MIRYTLTYGTLVKVLDDAPEGWDNHIVKFVRNETYHGIFREVSANMRFVGDGAVICKSAYFNGGVEAKVVLKIESWNKLSLTWETLLAAGEVDFSAAVATKDYFEAPVIDGGLSASFKARSETKYTLEARIDTVLRYLGVRLQAATAPWTKTSYQTPDVDYLNANHSIPIVAGTPTDATQGAFTMHTIPETAPGHAFYELPFLTADRAMIADLSFTATDIQMTTYLLASEYNGGTALDTWTFTLYLYHLDSVGATKALYTLKTFSIIPTHLDSGFYVNSVGGSMNETQQVIMADGDELKFNWRWSTADPDQYSTGHAVLSETGMNVTATIQAVLPQIDIPTYTAKELFTELADRMYNGCPVKSDFLDGLDTDEIPLFTSGDAIRLISPFNMKVSFNDFFNCLNSLYGVGVGVEVIGGVETLVLEERTYFYDSTQTYSLGVADGISISTASELLYNKLTIGYPNQEYEQLNGRDEFNAGQTWSIPYIKVIEAATQQSPIRADMYGIDNLRIQYNGNTDTDTKDDNDLFVIDSEFVETIAGVDYYKCSRDKVTYIDGLVNSDTAFNINYSPKRCLLRRKSELAGVCWGLSGNLELESFDKNVALESTIDGVLVNEDTDISISSLGTPLFKPFYFEFDVPQTAQMWSILAAIGRQAASFTYNGVTYYGFIMEAGINADHRITMSVRLLCAPQTDLTKLAEI